MQEQLKPCPFCGGEAREIESLFASIYCADCGVMGPKYLHMNQAIKHWNTRAYQTKEKENEDV